MKDFNNIFEKNSEKVQMWLLVEWLDPNGFLFQIWMDCNFTKMSKTCHCWYFGIRTNKVGHFEIILPYIL
jgi:hypothetical protein